MARPLAVALALLPLLAAAPALGKKPKPVESPPLEEVSASLIGEALLSELPYARLVELCDDYGHRLAGSAALDDAIAWGAERMREDGLANVHTEPVMVPRWIRGDESLALTAPTPRALPVLGLGGTIGTGPDGVEGEIVVAHDWEHLESLGDAVAGKIVLFDVPFTTYGTTVEYRGGGASAAARHGAVGMLLRSVGPIGHITPHTGGMHYDEGAPQIPAAAISAEDAARIRRDAERGKEVRARLTLGAHAEADAESANVIGEITGREHPEEVVVIGCHLDSWDVGQGAQDDGAGCVMVMEAARLIARQPVAPRRTVRVILYTNEENGLRGGRAYAEAHADEIPQHVAAIEADTGSGQPLGFRVDIRRDDEEQAAALGREALERLSPVSTLLAPVGAPTLQLSFAGADISPLSSQGVPSFGLDQDMEGYWPIHHTEADTVDKVDPALLARNVAAMAVMTWFLADSPTRVVD